METLLIGAIAGVGYYLNKDKRIKNNELKNNNIIAANEIPSSDNIYSSRHLDKVQEEVFKKATQNQKDSEKPMKTGIINGNTLRDNKKSYYKKQSIIQNEKDIKDVNIVSSTRFPQSSNSVVENSFKLLDNKDVEKFGIQSFNHKRNLMEQPSFQENHDRNNTSFFKTIKNGLYGKGINVYEKGHNNMEPFFGSSVKQNMNENANQTKLAHFTGSDDTFKHKKETKMLFKPVKQNIHGQQINRDDSRYIASMYTKRNQLPFKQIKVGPGLNSSANDLTTNVGFHDSYRPKQKTVDDLRVNPKETYKGRIAGEKHFVGLRGKSSKISVNRQSGSLSHINRQQLPNKNAVSGTSDLNKDSIVLRNVERNKYASAIEKFKGGKNNTGLSTYQKSNQRARYNIKQESQYHEHSHINVNVGGHDGHTTNPYDLAKTTIKQETQFHDHSHINLGGPDHAHKTSLNDKARNTIKQQTLSSYSGNKEGFTQQTQHLKDDAKTTIRQQTSRDYSGIKGSSDSATQSSRHNFYNAEINALKEQTVKRRNPVSQGAKNGPAKNQINFENTRKKQLNTYQFTKHYNPTAPGPTNKYNNGKFTRQKQVYNDRKFMNDRINPVFVDQFKKNPYTQSLHSFQNVHNPKSIHR
jgi:hypothetical protein